MKRIGISCETCHHSWGVEGGFDLYAQQAAESCPCPRCGAYTLSYHDPAAEPDPLPQPPSRRRSAHVQGPHTAAKPGSV